MTTQQPLGQLAIDKYIQRAMKRKHKTDEKVGAERIEIKVSNIKGDYVGLTHSLINSFPLNEIKNTAEEMSSTIQSPPKHSTKPQQQKEVVQDSNELTAADFKFFAAFEQPPQALINLMIAYIIILKAIKPKNLKNEYERVKNTPKTYKSCIELFRNPEVLVKLTKELVNNIKDVDIDHIVAIKDKYLVGSDIKEYYANNNPAVSKLLKLINEIINAARVN